MGWYSASPLESHPLVSVYTIDFGSVVSPLISYDVPTIQLEITDVLPVYHSYRVAARSPSGLSGEVIGYIFKDSDWVPLYKTE